MFLRKVGNWDQYYLTFKYLPLNSAEKNSNLLNKQNELINEVPKVSQNATDKKYFLKALTI